MKIDRPHIQISKRKKGTLINFMILNSNEPKQISKFPTKKRGNGNETN